MIDKILSTFTGTFSDERSSRKQFLTHFGYCMDIVTKILFSYSPLVYFTTPFIDTTLFHDAFFWDFLARSYHQWVSEGRGGLDDHNGVKSGKVMILYSLHWPLRLTVHTVSLCKATKNTWSIIYCQNSYKISNSFKWMTANPQGDFREKTKFCSTSPYSPTGFCVFSTLGPPIVHP